MINELGLENFKSFDAETVEFSNLNILSGLNGSGKSSVIQALCVLRQSFVDNTLAVINLNGELVTVGKGRDCLSDFADSDIVVIELKSDDSSLMVSFDGKSSLSSIECSESEVRQKIPDFFYNDFQLLVADRISPKTLYSQQDGSSYGANYLGRYGEYSIDFLAKNGDRFVSNSRRCGEKDRNSDRRVRLVDAIVEWLQMVSPGVSLEVVEIGGTDNVSLKYRYEGLEELGATNFYRPTNVGFGITYSLPIITSCLSIQRGGTLIVENPEAHLHPRAQFEMGKLLSLVAADGVQLLVETHSDHILNGIRLAVKNGVILSSQVSLNYFTRSVGDGVTQIENPVIKEDGKLNYWPDGFFDEWGRSLQKLLD